MEQPEFWLGRVPSDPTTSAGHGFGGGTFPPVPPPLYPPLSWWWCLVIRQWWDKMFPRDGAGSISAYKLHVTCIFASLSVCPSVFIWLTRRKKLADLSRDLRIGRLRSNRIFDSNLFNSNEYLITKISITNEAKESCGSTYSSLQSSNTLNYRRIWSLIELASLYCTTNRR